MIVLILWFIASLWLVNYQYQKQIKLNKIREDLAEIKAQCEAIIGQQPKGKPELKVLKGGKNEMEI